jgi:hypothetical protein
MKKFLYGTAFAGVMYFIWLNLTVNEDQLALFCIMFVLLILAVIGG